MSNLRASTVAITTIMYLAAVSMVVAQPTYYRVTFTDKGPDTFVPGSSAYNEALAAFHPRSLQRRAQVGMDPLLTKEDQPVDADYVQEILDLGIADPVVIHWRNCMIVNTDTITANRIKALPFVDSLVRTNTVAYTPLIDDCGPARPGENRRIHQALNTGTMIDAGVSGKGARVALLDNGFRLQRMTSLAHADIVATHDVIYGDDDVANGPNDPPEQDGHGSLVLSIAASWEQDSIIGVAPFASYLLVKTEDMRFERRVEEDFYTAAVEWAERNGADILSSSLGYRGFDSTEEQTPYRWFDGRSTFFSQAISMAVQRGMLCISAAGNGGPQDSTLYLPADADSGIAVGGSLWPSGFAWGMTSTRPCRLGWQRPCTDP
jgi:serine protease AprX